MVTFKCEVDGETCPRVMTVSSFDTVLNVVKSLRKEGIVAIGDGEVVFDPDGVAGDAFHEDGTYVLYKRTLPMEIESAYEEGASLLRTPDEPERAAALLLQAAQAGHMEAQALIGDCYYWGRGVPKDFVAAAEWYRRATEQGCETGMAGLAIALISGFGERHDEVGGLEIARRAAELGSPAGMRVYGWARLWGRGAHIDRGLGLQYIRRAAELGNAWAMHNLGCSFYVGEGVPVNKAEAARWFKQGAEKGNPAAMLHYATALEEGDGVKKDLKEAKRWYKAAAAAGDQSATAKCKALT